MSDVQTNNPHWVGDYPAWDITLSNGVVHKSVTEKDISVVLQKLHNKGVIQNHERYIDVVRKKDIDLYNKFHIEGIF